MLILVCGDRNWIDYRPIKRELSKYNPKTDVIMHGDARGADRISGQVAMALGFPVRPFPANWNRFGKAAGPIRNQQMLDERPDLVLAFHPNIEQSKGTGHMVRIARLKGVKVEVFNA